MNEHLAEPFGHSGRAIQPTAGPQQAQVWLVPQQLNLRIREYFEQAQKPVDGGAWLDRPEIPASAEVLDTETGGSHTSSEVALMCNRRKGAWNSKGKQPVRNQPEDDSDFRRLISTTS
jgi:helicase required for RNAi-mediated heterochromatin assembly 1